MRVMVKFLVSALLLSGCTAHQYAPGPGMSLGQLSPDMAAYSDDCSHRFRLKPATCSDRSQPVIPMIPAG